MMHSDFGHSWRTNTPVIQADSLGCVLWGGTVSWPQKTLMPLSILCGNTQGLRRLVSRLLGIQRVFREQDADSRDCPLHGYTWCSLLRTLPHLIHCLVVELGHLVQPSYSTFQNLHAGDGLGDPSSWASEDHLSLWCPIAVFSLPLHASCCKAKQIADLASFFHPHVQDVCRQAGDRVGTAVLCAADPPEVTPAKFCRQRCRWDIRAEWSRLQFHYSAACTIWTLQLTPGFSHCLDASEITMQDAVSEPAAWGLFAYLPGHRKHVSCPFSMWH